MFMKFGASHLETTQISQILNHIRMASFLMQESYEDKSFVVVKVEVVSARVLRKSVNCIELFRNSVRVYVAAATPASP